MWRTASFAAPGYNPPYLNSAADIALVQLRDFIFRNLDSSIQADSLFLLPSLSIPWLSFSLAPYQDEFFVFPQQAQQATPQLRQKGTLPLTIHVQRNALTLCSEKLQVRKDFRYISPPIPFVWRANLYNSGAGTYFIHLFRNESI